MTVYFYILITVLSCSAQFPIVSALNLPNFVSKFGISYLCHEVDNADPEEVSASFWRHAYCKTPLVIRGAVKTWPAFAKWTDDYIKSKSIPGKFYVEIGKKEHRQTRKTLAMTLADFIDGYHENDWYLVERLPTDLFNDISPPWFLDGNCSSHRVTTQQFPAVTLWMSSGGTKSNFHFDDLENIVCSVSGSKTIVLMDTVEGRKVLDIDPVGLYSALDVENVDMEKYSDLTSKPFILAELEAGDCIYIPYHWLHHIESFDRSIALSFWFYPYNVESFDCYPLFDDFSKVALENKEAIETVMKDVNPTSDFDPLSEDEFVNTIVSNLLPIDFLPSREKVEELGDHVRLFFYQFVDLDNDNFASEEEITRLSNSAITWLARLSKILFDDFYSGQCLLTANDDKFFMLDRASDTSHVEL